MTGHADQRVTASLPRYTSARPARGGGLSALPSFLGPNDPQPAEWDAFERVAGGLAMALFLAVTVVAGIFAFFWLHWEIQRVMGSMLPPLPL